MGKEHEQRGQNTNSQLKIWKDVQLYAQLKTSELDTN